MRSFAARRAVALVAVGSFEVARACSVCSRGDPLARAAEGHGSGGDLRVALEAESLSQRSGSPGVATMHDDLDQYSLKLTTVYSPVPPLNLVVAVPFTRKQMTMEHGPGVTLVASDLTGVGSDRVPNTGGLVLWASPSAQVNVTGRLWATLRAQLPFYTSLVGDQTVGSVVTAGLQYSVF